MSWTAPMTAVVGATLTAAQWNANVRDNLLETCVAKATTNGSYFVGRGVNSVAEVVADDDTVATQEDTTSTTYTNLTTVGPQVTLTTGAAAFVTVTAMIAGPGLGNSCHADFTISGATTRAASDTTCLRAEHDTNEFNRMSVRSLVTGLNPGVNVFTMVYKTGTAAAIARFRDRNMIVEPL